MYSNEGTLLTNVAALLNGEPVFMAAPGERFWFHNGQCGS